MRLAAMRISIYALLSFFLVFAAVDPARAGVVGKALGEAGFGEQTQQLGDEVFTAASAARIGGSEVQSATPPFRPDGPAVPRPLRSRGAEAARGISGVMGELVLNSGEITCSLWLIQLRSHLRNLTLVISRMIQLGEDEAEISRLSDLAKKTEAFASALERSCTEVGWSTSPPSDKWKTTTRIGNALGLGGAEAPAQPETVPEPEPEPTIPEGWNEADIQCRDLCGPLFEKYSNTRAQAQNKRRDARNLNGELEQAKARERQAERNLDETRANRKTNPANVRRDERQLGEAQAATQAVQQRIDRLNAEADAKQREAEALLQRLKECIKNCRKEVRDATGVDAGRFEAYFTNNLDSDGHRLYNALPDATPAPRQTTGNKGAPVADKQTKGVLKGGPTTKLQDGAPPVKEGGPKRPLEKTPPVGNAPSTGLPGVKQEADGSFSVDESWPRTERGDLDYQYVPIRTSCVPCQYIAANYTNTMYLLHASASELKRLPGEKQAAIEAARARVAANAAKNGSTTDSTAAEMINEISDIEAGFAASEATIRAKVARDTATLQMLADALADCERQHCNGQPGNSGLHVRTGTGGGNAGGGLQVGTGGDSGVHFIRMPFTWNGPYQTRCFPCQKLAEDLNKTYELARNNIGHRYMLEMYIANQQVTLDHPAPPDKHGAGFGWNAVDPAITRENIARTSEQLREQEAQMERIAAHFNTVLGMLADCERKYCPPAQQGRKKVSIGGKTKVTLEQTVKVTGTDPFSVRDVEEAGINGGGIQVAPPVVVTPPVTTPTGSSASGSSGGSSASGSSSGGTSPPVTSPLEVFTNGSISFAHTVGTSSCPQSAGTVIIRSNNGNPLNVTGVSVSGTIQPKLTVTLDNNSSAFPRFVTEFNCSSPTNGTFTGNVTATVTDTVTGETQTISVPASGSVSG